MFKTKPFDGVRDEAQPEKGIFSIWYMRMEMLTRAADPQVRLQVLTQALAGEALSYYTTLPENVRKDHEALVEQLTERYRFTITEQQLARCWDNFRLDDQGESYDEYVTRLLNFIATKQHMEKSTICKMYKKKKMLFGLPKLAINRILLRYATQHTGEEPTFDQHTTMVRPVAVEALSARNCGGKSEEKAVLAGGESEQDAFEEEEMIELASAASPEPLTCHNCNKVGHLRCPEARTSEGQARIDQFKQRMQEAHAHSLR